MNASAVSPTLPNRSSVSIVLTVEGLGHVPSFKNKKRAILDRATGKMRTLTEPDAARWMRRCEGSFASQLLSTYQTTEKGMPMVRSLRSWIACVMPRTDSVRHLIEFHVRVVPVRPGQEGARLEITPAHL
jgi:hypothetical protein